MSEESFIMLARKTFNNFLWTEEREFSKFEAWLDMIASARWDDRAGSQLVNAKRIELKRGELIASIRYHAKRWNWSEKKVRNFRKILTEGTMIAVRRAQGETVIKLCSYDTYNTVDSRKGTGKARKRAQEGHTEGTGRAQEGHKEEERKEGKKENNKRGAQIPKNLQTPAFKSKWNQWVDCRMSMKRPKSWDALFKEQIDWLSAYPEHEAIEILSASIRNGWQGLFAPKENNNRSQTSFKQRGGKATLEDLG